MATVSTNSIAEYIQAKERRKNVMARIQDGEIRYWHYDRWIDKKQYNLYYPICNYVPLELITNKLN